MITLDDMKAALGAPDPSDPLDALVRRELALGQTTQAIYDRIKSLMPDVMRLPEYAGEAEEDLDGTMDALRGWVSPACCYSDVPDLKVLESYLPEVATIPDRGPEIADAFRRLIQMHSTTFSPSPATPR